MSLAPFGGATAAGGLPGSTLGLVLKGILMAYPPSASTALITVGEGPAAIYGVGQTPVGDAVIESIEIDHVILSSGGERQRLTIARLLLARGGTVSGSDARESRVLAASLQASLLPAFRGAHAVRDALAYGVKVTGCTVHLVDEEVDHGPVLFQAAVPVEDGDDEDRLHERIKREEHRLLPLAVRLVAEGRVRVVEERAEIAGGSGAAAPSPILLNPPETSG